MFRRGWDDLSFDEWTTFGSPSRLERMNLEDASGIGLLVNV
jgi:hypothetical protein